MDEKTRLFYEHVSEDFIKAYEQADMSQGAITARISPRSGQEAMSFKFMVIWIEVKDRLVSSGHPRLRTTHWPR